MLALMCASAFGQGLPGLTDINPKTGSQGATVAVTLTGTNFVSGSTSVSVTGTGIMPLSVSVSSATTATVTLVLSGIPGKYPLKVVTPAGSSSTQQFVVTGSGVTIASQFDVSSLAGPDGGPGSLDGSGKAARFSTPIGVWVNGSMAYIADSINNTIRQVTIPSGDVTTIAGTPGVAGVADGIGASAQFFGPTALWGDSTNLYIADQFNLEIRKLQLSSGTVTTIAGSAKLPAAQVDGVGTKAQFVGPTGIWGDGTNLYVADTLSTGTRAIRKIVLSTGQVTTVADLGPSVPSAASTSLSLPAPLIPVGLWGDGSNLYIADSGRHTIRRMNLVSNGLTTYSGIDSLAGSADGTTASFRNPSAIWGNSKVLYVADTGNDTIRTLPIGNTTPSVGTVAGAASSPGATDAIAANARFNGPAGIAGAGTTLLITELRNNDVRMMDLSTGGVTTLAGVSSIIGFADGVGSSARFASPWGICGDAANTYIADYYNLDIRRLDRATGSVLTIAGSPTAGGNIDGSALSQARFGFPTGAWCDGTNVFVTDSYFDTIRQFNRPNNFVSTLAGNARANSGYLDGVGTNTLFNSPSGIWGDGKNLYVTDLENAVIRKIVISSASVSTLAGTANITGSVDGIGISAKFLLPTSLWGDGTNLYVTDADSIRKIDLATGAVTTLAGSGNRRGSNDGVGTGARFFLPFGIWGDGSSLFVADTGNSLIRKIDLQTGTVTTVAGLVPGSENGRGSAGRLNLPVGIWGDGSALYVVDSGSNRIRKLAPVPPPDPTTVTNPGDIKYQIVDRGGLSQVSSNGPNTQVGYARILPTNGSATPSGVAIFGFRQNGTLVSEAAVPASPLIQSGRIYAEIGGAVNTGLAIANPNNQSATVSFFFTDAIGTDQLAGTTTIAANGQTAAFLNQSPFFNSSSSQVDLSTMRTFTFSSNFPIGVVALRGLTNERSEFLITTLPVTSLDQPSTSTSSVAFPHFADGGGWKTRVILVNPTDATLTGSMQFFSQGSAATPGGAIVLTANGTTSDTFNYSIPPRSSYKLETSATGANVLVGSVRVTPATGNLAPSGLVVFSFKSNGITVSEAGVAAMPSSFAFRLYAEASGNFNAGAVGSIQTGFAISNPSASSTTVNFELTTLDGVSTGLTGSAAVPASGQIAMFLSQIQGLANLPNPFRGVLRITGGTVNVTGLRGRYNERGDFLITTTAPINEAVPPTTSEMIFPHLVDGGGYTTQFVLFSSSVGQTSTGVLRFFSQSGEAITMTLQ
jgi:hypothetical protein